MKQMLFLMALSAISLWACGQNPSRSSAADAPVTVPAPSAATAAAEESKAQLAVLPVTEYVRQRELLTGALTLDVRTSGEYQGGHVPDALNMDFYAPDFSSKLTTLDREKPIFLYCASGNRSGQTLAMMRQMGFKAVFDLQGGFGAWARAGLPVVR